ncbi:MAG: hypothetical protein KAT46_02365 [Deltaproteobacteria bacterium]|nr:hypothetical protein [Deltaproteobacteria bacterium]
MRWIFYCFLVISLLLPLAAGSAEVASGLIAVSVDGKTQGANVSSKAARSAYYMIFDNKGKLLDVIGNPVKNAGGEAGPSAANFLSNKGVTIVVAETFGNKMINSMKTKGIKFIEFKGTAGEAIKEVLKLK